MDLKKNWDPSICSIQETHFKEQTKSEGVEQVFYANLVKTNLLVCLHREKAEPILDDSMKTFKYELYKTVVLNSKYKTYL